MKILIVEDEQNKMEQIKEVLQNFFAECLITESKSFNSGIRELKKSLGDFSLVILDMSLPTYDVNDTEDGGRPRTFGGKNIFNYMERWEYEIPIIIITQFDRFGHGSNEITIKDLETDLSIEYSKILKGVIHYSSAVDEWRGRFISLLEELIFNKGIDTI